MLAAADSQRQGGFEARSCGNVVQRDSPYDLLGEHRERIVAGEDFGGPYPEPRGCASIPPSLLTKVLQLAPSRRCRSRRCRRSRWVPRQLWQARNRRAACVRGGTNSSPSYRVSIQVSPRSCELPTTDLTRARRQHTRSPLRAALCGSSWSSPGHLTDCARVA
jgi:hypothetical protein